MKGSGMNRCIFDGGKCENVDGGGGCIVVEVRGGVGLWMGRILLG